MRVYISADIEGISGVATWDQARTDGPDHGRARIWMTEDVNAAVAGAVEAGAREVVVRDAHGRARNILWEALHPAARLISGWDPRVDMMMGIDSTFGLAMLIGYHPGPTVRAGLLSHAFSGRIRGLRLNGMPCNEATIAALQAGAQGVPIGLVTGQLELLEEIRPTIPDAVFVSTKRGLAYQAALLEPAPLVRGQIHAAARAATAAAVAGQAPAPFRPAAPLLLEIDVVSVEATDALQNLTGIERTAASASVLSAPDAPSFIERFFLMLQLLYAVKDSA